MSKLQLSDAEREYLPWSRALATDSDGNETLRGLDAADSVEYLRWPNGNVRAMPEAVTATLR